jgi:TonB family protein
MELRRNILFSLIFHITIITAVFSVIGRDRVDLLVPADYMIVSLFKEMAGITSIASHSTKKVEDKISSVIVKRESTNQSPLPALPSQGSVVATLSEVGTTRFRDSHRESPRTDGKVSERVYKEEISSGLFNNDNKSTSVGETITEMGLKNDISRVAVSPHIDRSEEITSSQNTGFSTIKSSYKGNTNNPYDLIRASIEKVKTYPSLARKKRIEGTVITGFTINSKGYPQHIKVEKSSGAEILDSAAIKIIMKAAPFPEVTGEILVPITFRLTDYISSR